MKQTIQGFILAGTLVLGGTALAQQAKGGTAELRGFVVPTDEKALLERLHYTNQLEIKLGQLAQQNSTNPDVKAFGENMVREHTAADEKLMSLAKSRGLKLADKPKPINDAEKRTIAADKAVMEELQALKGEPFDSCYIANQVGDHDATLGKLLAGQQAITTNAELTSLITELTQHVAQHRQQAYSVLGKLGPQALGLGVGGAGTNGNKGAIPSGPTGSGATGTTGTGTGAGGVTGSDANSTGTKR